MVLQLTAKFLDKASTALATIPCVHVTMLAPYPYPPIAREMGLLVVIELHCTATSPLHHNIYILQCYKETRRREGQREGEEKIVLYWS